MSTTSEKEDSGSKSSDSGENSPMVRFLDDFRFEEYQHDDDDDQGDDQYEEKRTQDTGGGTAEQQRKRRNRKRKRSKSKNRSRDASGFTDDESADADVESNGASPSSSRANGNYQLAGNSGKSKKHKRKHHSLPKRNERVGADSTGSDSDLQRQHHRSSEGESGQNQNNGSVSSVSESEDFEYNDEYRNLYASARLFDKPRGGRRPIAIDGCNVAWGHGNDQQFSWKGIALCADYFRARGHRVKAFVPRQYQSMIDREVVDELIRDEILVFTPSRNPGNQGRRITAYDDRFIVQYAVCTGGVVISNDNFTDLWTEQPTWRETISNRVLQHTWVSKDILMFQLDPLGRRGKTLDEFLTFD